MAEQAYAYVTLIPVAKGFKSALTKELNGVQGAGNVAGEQTGKGFSSGFGKSLGGLAVAAGAALGAIGVGRFFSESIKEASDLGESINAVNVAYGEFAGDVLKLGDGVSKRLGLSTVDFNAAAVRFSAFAERIAGDGGDVAGVVDSLSSRAADFASVFNIDVSEALQVFQSGLAGEAEPLKRFGINLLDSEVQAYAFANGIGEVGRQLTETEKVQARYGLLLQSTAKTQGDFANTSDGLANSQRILQASITDLQAEIGEGLAPVLATLAATMVPLAETLFPKLAAVINDQVAPVLSDFAQDVRRIVGQFTTGYLTLEGVIDRIAFKIDEFFTGGGLDKISNGLDTFQSKIRDVFITLVPKLLESFVTFLPQVLDFLITQFSPKVNAELITIINTLVTTVAQLLPQFVTTILKAVPSLLMAATELFSQLIEAVIDITPGLIDTIIALLPKMVESILSMLPQILESAIELFKAIVMAVPKIIPPLITAIIDLLPVIIDTVIDMLPELIDAAFELFTGIVTAIFEATPEIQAALAGLLPKMITTILGFVPKFFEAGADIIGGLAKGIIENGPRILGGAITSVVNGVINSAKALLGINSPSKVFAEMGQNIGDGLINGIEGTYKGVRSAADGLAVLATGSTAGTMGLSLNSDGASLSTSGASISMPINKFDGGRASMDNTKAVNYYAAPNQSIDSEAELFQAMRRAKVVVGW